MDTSNQLLVAPIKSGQYLLNEHALLSVDVMSLSSTAASLPLCSYPAHGDKSGIKAWWWD